MVSCLVLLIIEQFDREGSMCRQSQYPSRIHLVTMTIVQDLKNLEAVSLYDLTNSHHLRCISWNAS